MRTKIERFEAFQKDEFDLGDAHCLVCQQRMCERDFPLIRIRIDYDERSIFIHKGCSISLVRSILNEYDFFQ